MTFTVPHRSGPPRAGASNVARPGVIYGYNVRDATTGVVHPHDYIGQTRNLERRDRQHRGLAAQRDGTVRQQPWSDLIDSGPHVLEAGVWTDDDLDARELAWIVGRRPRLNCQMNESNPHRIRLYVQRQQRADRDRDRAPHGPWAPVRRPSTPATTRPRRQPTRRPRPRRLRRACAVWLVLTLAVWLGLWMAVDHIGVDLDAVFGLPVAGLAAAGAITWWKRSRRTRARRFGR